MILASGNKTGTMWTNGILYCIK